MKILLKGAILVMLTAGITACAEPEKPSSLNVERSTVSSTVATIESVDLKTRMVKLRSLEGRPFTIHVGDEAVNLPQAKAGDKVEITYSQSLEVRMAEPGEIRNETDIIVGGATPGSKPSGIGITETNITATILELDKVNETATLKMADGVVAKVKVQNPANLDKVKVGDTIAISYLEAIEINVVGKQR